MLIVHAAVEQFGTLIDEMICEDQPDFLSLHHDDRLLILLFTLRSTLPGFIVVRGNEAGGTALPDHKILELVGPTAASWPSRTIRFDDIAASRALCPHLSLIERFVQAFLRLPIEDLYECILRFEALLLPVRNSLITIVGWDDSGRMRLSATHFGAQAFGVPLGADIQSAIGGHRAAVNLKH